VTPVLRHLDRNDDEVGDADADLLMAARAEVRLARLERVDERNLEVVVVRYPRNAHSSSTATTTNAASTNR
jgi:hypothetical protein